MCKSPDEAALRHFHKLEGGKIFFKATFMETPKRILLELIQFQSVSLRTFSTNTGLGAEQYGRWGALFPRAQRLPCSIPKPRKHRLGKMITSKGLLSIICNFIFQKCACTNPRDPAVLTFSLEESFLKAQAPESKVKQVGLYQTLLDSKRNHQQSKTYI